MKILLVDDSPLMARFMAALLARRGHEVRLAHSMAESLESVMRELPDAVVMDFILEPGRTGLEAISAMFALLESQGKSRPRTSIVTSGRLAAADEARALALGVCLIQKPEHGQEEAFLQAVDNWIRI